VLNGLGELSERYEQIGLRQRLREERVKSLAVPVVAGAPPIRAGHLRDLYLELAEVAVGLALGMMLEGTGMLHDDEADAGRRQDFYDGAEERELRANIRAVVDALPELERRVIRYHYFQGLSFTEIAGLLELTKGRVSQIHHQALQLIRSARGGGGFDLLV
jgi:RNA polymerase sigma factor FliA